MTVDFVGVGRMGSRMARRVLAAGFTVRAFGRSSDVMRAAVATGAQPTATAAALAAASDVVVSVLPDAEAVEAAIEGADGIAAGVRSGAVVVEVSTLSPAASPGPPISTRWLPIAGHMNRTRHWPWPRIGLRCSTGTRRSPRGSLCI